MKKQPAKPFTAQLVEYLITHYFDGDIDAFAKRTAYSKHHVQTWCSGRRKPQRASVRWMLSATIAPEFKVVAEFATVDFRKTSDIRQELNRLLSAHGDKAGVYAFYDSMCNVI
jgi:hypothetical protein